MREPQQRPDASPARHVKRGALSLSAFANAKESRYDKREVASRKRIDNAKKARRGC